MSLHTTTMHITFENPDQPEVIELIAELDAYQDTLYPPESRHALDLASLRQSNVLLAVARDADARAVACGAAVLHSGFGEIKRMYVHPRARGRGVARAMLAMLEAGAVWRDCDLLRLETGPRQPEAIALYAACGYVTRGPFADYRDDPLSVFMEKRIIQTSVSA